MLDHEPSTSATSPYRPRELRATVAIVAPCESSRPRPAWSRSSSAACWNRCPPSAPQPPPRSRSQDLRANDEDRTRGFLHDSLADAALSAQSTETTAAHHDQRDILWCGLLHDHLVGVPGRHAHNRAVAQRRVDAAGPAQRRGPGGRPTPTRPRAARSAMLDAVVRACRRSR